MKESRVKKLLKLFERKNRREFIRYVKEKRLNLDSVLTDPESGSNQGSCLHLACQHDRDDILRYLLSKKVDASVVNGEGNTAVYVALKRAVFVNSEAFSRLVSPLLEYCPESLDVVNHKGRTGRELLQEWHRKVQAEQAEQSESECSGDEVTEDFTSRLRAEAEDEYQQTWGEYENDFCQPDQEPETASDWAERIAGERKRKLQSKAYELHGHKRRKKDENDEKQKEFTAKLERDHKEYVERMAKLRERKIHKTNKLKYFERWSQLKSLENLQFDDIPWPSLENLEEFLLSDVDKKDLKLCRKLLRQEQIRWHPDKFEQKFGGKIAEKEKTKVEEKVKVVSQEVNRLSEKFSESKS